MSAHPTPDAARNRRVAALAAGVAVGMLGLAYASVPLYRMFCQATGFGGTTQRAEVAPATATTKAISIRFDANIDASLPWMFHPKQVSQTVKIGEVNMAYFVATNRSDRTTTGSAVFNVTPTDAGAYFNKIACFCFTEQTLKPGETVEMPVQFFVDPAMLQDKDARYLKEITLSYTFYPAATPASEQQAVAKTN